MLHELNISIKNQKIYNNSLMIKKIVGANLNSLFRSYLYSSKSYRERTEKARQTDYAAKRKNAVDSYNNLIKQEKASYNEIYKRYEINRGTVTTQNEEEKLQSRFSQYLDVYYAKIEGLALKLKKQLDQIQMQEKTDVVKTYLLDNLPDDEETTVDKTPNNKNMYIPNRLILKKIYHGPREKAKQLHPSRQILLAGVEKQEDHSLFLSKLIEEMSIKNVVTMISPDLPYFIKTEKSYLQEWSKFIANNEYAKKCKFYLNPQPKNLQDICLHDHHIPLVRNALSRSRTFLQNYYCLMKQNDVNKNYEPAPLFTGLTSQTVKRIYFANYPAFQERRMIADQTSLAKLRQLFQLHLRNFRLGKLNFAAQWLFPKEVLSKKLGHLIGVTRAVVESTNERTLLICSAEIADLLSIEWQLSKEKLNYNYQDRNYYFNFNHKLEGGEDQSFMDFIEKLVILDLIVEPIFTRYFVKYRSFPFLCEHTIGGKQNVGKIFAVWMHFYNTYYSLLTEKRLQTDESLASQKKEYINQFQNPTNFT